MQLTKKATLCAETLFILFLAASSLQADVVNEKWVARYNGSVGGFRQFG
jgi:hypothetical protein